MQINCQIRKEMVVATPEERVRQNLLYHMIHELGFPASHIVLEKSLRQMPHLTLADQNIPDRRADIVCFAQEIHPQHALYPLLVVECKAVDLNGKVINQVLGYNHFLRAYFVAVANETCLKTGWYDPSLKTYRFVDHLPRYNDLLLALNPAKRSHPQSL